MSHTPVLNIDEIYAFFFTSPCNDISVLFKKAKETEIENIGS